MEQQPKQLQTVAFLFDIIKNIFLNATLELRFLFPEAQILSCCNVYADMYIKISYRDNECNECDTIIPVRVSLVKTKSGKPVDINLPDNPPPGTGRKAVGYVFSLK